MAFDNELFPYVPMKHDQRRTVIDPVSINTNGNYEYRVKRAQWEKFNWEIVAQTMTNAQKEAVRQFLSARGSAHNSFLYDDPELSHLEDVPLALVSGTTQNWALYLPFGTSTPGTAHPLFDADPTILLAYMNGGTTPVAATYEEINGIPTFNISASGPTDDITISGTYYYTVRLDSSFSDTLYAMDCNNKAIGHQVSAIALAEVYGES